MVGRALNLATVMLLLCWGLIGSASAQENLDAGKNPAQLFTGNCTACHKSPRGLLKSVAPGSLPGFLRQHYTTGPEMAGVLSSYILSNGAGDGRAMGDQPKGGKSSPRNAKPDTRSEAPPPAPAAPSSGPLDGLSRLFHRTPPEQASPPPDSQQAPPRGKRRAKHPAKPVAEEPAKPEDAPSDAAHVEAPKVSDAPVTRTDPVPQVTPATPSR